MAESNGNAEAGKRKVLITGGAGLIGGILIDRLGDRYELSSLDLREADGVESHVASLDDLEAMQPAFAGVDTVVHLAADRSAYAEWDSVLSNNLVGTYNVFEASRREGVKRVIFASSNHATGGNYLDEPWSLVGSGQFEKLEAGAYPLVDEDVMIRPDGFYGISKAFGEAIGSYYNDYHELSSIHLRIGWVISTDDPSFSPFALSLWLSHADVAQIVRLCVDAPETLRYGIYYATSDNKWKIFDISRAKAELGFVPEDGSGDHFEEGPPPVRDR